jgi:hypothetical protein
LEHEKQEEEDEHGGGALPWSACQQRGLLVDVVYVVAVLVDENGEASKSF